jgi:hypothetical protein
VRGCLHSGNHECARAGSHAAGTVGPGTEAVPAGVRPVGVVCPHVPHQVGLEHRAVPAEHAAKGLVFHGVHQELDGATARPPRLGKEAAAAHGAAAHGAPRATAAAAAALRPHAGTADTAAATITSAVAASARGGWECRQAGREGGGSPSNTPLHPPPPPTHRLGATPAASTSLHRVNNTARRWGWGSSPHTHARTQLGARIHTHTHGHKHAPVRAPTHTPPPRDGAGKVAHLRPVSSASPPLRTSPPLAPPSVSSAAACGLLDRGRGSSVGGGAADADTDMGACGRTASRRRRGGASTADMEPDATDFGAPVPVAAAPATAAAAATADAARGTALAGGGYSWGWVANRCRARCARLVATNAHWGIGREVAHKEGGGGWARDTAGKGGGEGGGEGGGGRQNTCSSPMRTTNATRRTLKRATRMRQRTRGSHPPDGSCTA